MDVHLLRSVVAAGDEVGGKTFKSNVAAIRADRDELGSAVALSAIARHRDALRRTGHPIAHKRVKTLQ